MPNFILLTGAGFSRNWGGWLAAEVFDYLLGHPRIDEGLRKLLWRHKEQGGGFESAVDEQRSETARNTERYRAEREKAVHTSMMGVISNTAMLDQSQRLDDAIRGMFADMNREFANLPNFEYEVVRFLTKFDAIFTLNQDLLLEFQYLTRDDLGIHLSPRVTGAYVPGLQPIPDSLSVDGITKWRPVEPFALESNLQPYFKLHGSSNWIDDNNGQPMLVIGANKESDVARQKILIWNHDQFKKYLAKPDTRLMVIGYSFRDAYVNRYIQHVAERGTLRLFIVDLSGVDVLKNAPERYGELSRARTLLQELQPLVIGASTRTLREIFGDARLERGKVMRFFE